MRGRLIFSIAVVASVLFVMLASLPARAQMTQVNNGTAANITGPTYGCRKVTNNSGLPIMVPWNTAAEWLTVINTPGPGVSISGCGCTGTPWGTVADGFSGTAYSTNSVTCGNSCPSQVRTCSSGSMSGSYGYTSCTNTALNSSQCASAASVQCWIDIYDNCGNWCGYSGTGLRPSYCPAASSVSCNQPVTDPCGNYCGYTGTANCGSICGGWSAWNDSKPWAGVIAVQGGHDENSCKNFISSYNAPCGELASNGDCYAETGNCNTCGGCNGGWKSIDCTPR